MVKKCCISKCRSESYGGCGISFHKFPKKEGIKKLWLDIVPVAGKITDNSVVCSHHFKPEDFHTFCSRQALNHDAVPSIFLEQKQNEKMWVSNVALQLNTVAEMDSPEYSVIKVVNELNEINKKNENEDDSAQPPAEAISLKVKEVAVQTDMKNFSATYESLQRKVKILSQRLKRRDRQIKSLRSITAVFKKKCSYYEKSGNVIETNLSNENINKSVKYSEEVKEFAQSLYIHSPKSYLYLRHSLSLPHPTSIRKMLASYEGDASSVKIQGDITDADSDPQSSSPSEEFIEPRSTNCTELN